MIAAFDWTNLSVAGAFIVGMVGGTIATIRLTRYLLEYLRGESGRDKSPPPSQSAE